MTSHRLFPSADGTASAVSYSGSFIVGVVFTVTTGGMWFGGYWWWVCPAGQSTSPQKFALWAAYGTDQGALVPGSPVTSGLLTQGWNYVPLPGAVPVSIGASYVAATGVNGGFPSTPNVFGSGDPYGAGIVAGPLTGYSDQTGSLTTATPPGQCTYQHGGWLYPGTYDSVFGGQNRWVDVEVTPVGSAAGSLPLIFFP